MSIVLWDDFVMEKTGGTTGFPRDRETNRRTSWMDELETHRIYHTSPSQSPFPGRLPPVHFRLGVSSTKGKAPPFGGASLDGRKIANPLPSTTGFLSFQEVVTSLSSSTLAPLVIQRMLGSSGSRSP
tara:strand:+ start:890 stop:1270 length:381 start_codon:yes stop_codon:yes gene_type:complete